MTVIAEKDREVIRGLLGRELTAAVELLFFTRSRSPLVVPGRQDCESCAETHELLDELAALGDAKLTLTTHDLATDPSIATTYNVTHVPTVAVRRAPRVETSDTRDGTERDRSPDAASEAADPTEAVGDVAYPLGNEVGTDVGVTGANVRFIGLPGGYEFSTLVADIVDVSRGHTDLAEATRTAVRAIDTPVHLQVFVTPT